jgi:hypothetical protein
MSHRVPCPRSPDFEESINQLQSFLTEALNLADSLALPPEIGARIQEALDSMESSLRPDGPES